VVLMSLVASHHDLDLSVLERLSADSRAVGREIVSGSAAVSGAVVLATCNRFELYLDVADAADADTARDSAASAVAARSGYAADRVRSALAPATGPHVVEHLFAVASGLESMVVGEREIAGQVRRALTAATAPPPPTSRACSRPPPAPRAPSARAPGSAPPDAPWWASRWTWSRRTCPTGPPCAAC
jgi:glutamyl-tRNA reductase